MMVSVNEGETILAYVVPSLISGLPGVPSRSIFNAHNFHFDAKSRW